MFYDTGKPKCSPECNPSCGCGKYVEIWNNVFMEFYKDENGKYSKLKQHNVDTGLGLERMTMLLEGKETPFETELFAPIMDKLVELQKVDNIASRRIVAEHLYLLVLIIHLMIFEVYSYVLPFYELIFLIYILCQHCLVFHHHILSSYLNVNVLEKE